MPLISNISVMQGYIFGRKTSRAQGETDVMVICYSPTLHWSTDGVSNSEGDTRFWLIAALWTAVRGLQHYQFRSCFVTCVYKHFSLWSRLLLSTKTLSTECSMTFLDWKAWLQSYLLSLAQKQLIFNFFYLASTHCRDCIGRGPINREVFWN